MKTVKNILDKVTSYASVFIFIMMVLRLLPDTFSQLQAV
mgnify:CR=1 FL=1